MDLGDDHLGRKVTDDSLSYKEFIKKLEEYRMYPRAEFVVPHPPEEHSPRTKRRGHDTTLPGFRTSTYVDAQGFGGGPDAFRISNGQMRRLKVQLEPSPSERSPHSPRISPSRALRNPRSSTSPSVVRHISAECIRRRRPPKDDDEPWAPDDFNGDIKRAEDKLYMKITNFLKTSNMMSLFRMMDRSKNGELCCTEWVEGLLQFVKVKNSRKMLRMMYSRMDVGNDHLGSVQSDGSLSYLELLRRVSGYRKYPAPTLPNRTDDRTDSDIPNLWCPTGSKANCSDRPIMPI